MTFGGKARGTAAPAPLLLRGRVTKVDHRRVVMSAKTAGHKRIRTVLTGSAGEHSEILDIFEGTQQIQKLIVARRLLGKPSAELKYPCL